MGTRTSRKRRIAGLLLAGGLWSLGGAADAQEGNLYVGVSGLVDRLDGFYEKTVDNTDPHNTSPSRGQVYRSDDQAAGTTHGVGVVAGYRVSPGATDFYLSTEADLTAGGGAVQGRLEGAGLSEGRNQLGESWPEDWSLGRGRSYGLTVRVGRGIRAARTDSELSVYGLGGVRRLATTLMLDYAGCFRDTLCAPGELTPAMDTHEEAFTGWAAGGGFEKRFGSAAVRSELRYTAYGNAERVVPYDELAISVPLRLSAHGASMVVSLLWHF